MTLIEKFKIINCTDCDMPYCDIKCTILAPYELDKLEQIANDYAIEFAEWLANSYYSYNFGIKMFEHRNKEIYKTTKELLEIYKKEKGL